MRLLTVGRLDTEKNPLLLADVLAALSGDGFRLDSVGEGRSKDDLRARLEALGVADRAALLGFVPSTAGSSTLSPADVFLHVSWTEGLPQVLLEAFAAALPVVATDVGGVARRFAARRPRPPGDASPRRRRGRQLAADRSLRRELVAEGAGAGRRGPAKPNGAGSWTSSPKVSVGFLPRIGINPTLGV